ncbi:WD40-repeat-containing domain protein [Suillus ampliporus]|nr:WD40-repeat-containing domain protein [Suillus ampliporus]
MKTQVASLCWSKDGAYIFSGAFDDTIRKWRSIDGKELVLLRGHTYAVRSLCLSPDESHLVSASGDCSVRIWDLKTNQQVGDQLLHDDEVLALAMFPDGKHIASAGIDAKIYVWSLEAALKHQGGDQSADDSIPKLKGRPRDIFDARLVSQQLTKNRGLAKYGDDFWGNDMNRTLRRGGPPASSSSSLHWRSLFGSLRFSVRPTDAPQPISLQPRHWNFDLFSVGRSGHPVDVAPARDEDRYGIAPETDAEAAAAMQRTNGNEAGSSTHPGQPVAGVQGPQERPTEIQGSTGGTGEVSYEVNCCGLFFGVRRPSSHQS